MQHVRNGERPGASLETEKTENGPINVLRSVAALAVVIGHARTLFMRDYDDVPHNAVQAILYGTSALGHQAVVVFFVLSGYWVGGSVLRQIRSARFSWTNYVLDRTARLWVVLIPALLLTVLCDIVGRIYFGDMSAYTGDTRYGGVALEQHPIDALTFLGNAFFLQDIRFMTLGSNTSLWSLSYEFWLYILAPLVLLICLRGKNGILINFLLLVMVAGLVGIAVMAYLPLWFLGALVAAAQDRITPVLNQLSSVAVSSLRVGAATLTLLVAIVVRGLNSLPLLLGDYLVAVPATFLLATLVTGFVPSGWGERVLGRWALLAHSSYSLYAIHVPLLVLLASISGVEVDSRWPSDFLHWTYLGGVVTLMVVSGWLFAQVTERHNVKIKALLRKRVARPIQSLRGTL